MSVLVVLLAAGLTCGDGRQGLETARAPVAAKEEVLRRLDGTWEGTWEGYGEAEEYICWRVAVSRGKLRVISGERTDVMWFAVTPDGRGQARVVIDGESSLAIYRLDRGRLIICASVWSKEGPRPTSFKARPWYSQLFILTPASPRKR
jgi:hypothetical protein